MGCSVVTWPIYLHLNPFFWLVKRGLMKLDLVHVWGVVVVSEFGLVSKKNWMSLSWKGVCTVSVPPLQYLPGIRRKNNSIQVRWVTGFGSWCLPGRLYWSCGGWILVGGGLCRAEGLLSFNLKSVFPYRIQMSLMCLVRGRVPHGWKVTVYILLCGKIVLNYWTRLSWGLKSISLKCLYQVWHMKEHWKLYCYGRKQC